MSKPKRRRRASHNTKRAVSAESEIIQIEKGVPVPPKLRKATRFPIAKMEVGDSFVVTSGLTTAKSVVYREHKLSKKRFTTRQQPDGSLRIWRIE